RPEEASCALELLEAVLNPSEGNTYEALLLVDEDDRAVAYACFGQTPMTDATFDLYWMITAAARRGQGLGGRLLHALEQALGARARAGGPRGGQGRGQGGGARAAAAAHRRAAQPGGAPPLAGGHGGGRGGPLPARRQARSRGALPEAGGPRARGHAARLRRPP